MNAKDRRAARHQPTNPASTPPPRRRATPITPTHIVDTALTIIAGEGYEALTMRRLASALDTGPASLYAHVVNKADLDELLIGRLCGELTLPQPDPTSWRAQLHDVCTQLRDRYLSYPGISSAALALAPTDLEITRISEGLLAILIAAGIPPQTAAWAIDALLLYIAAYCLEDSIRHQRATHDDAFPRTPEQLRQHLAALPADAFPHTIRHANELTAGEDHDRFDFTITMMIEGIANH